MKNLIITSLLAVMVFASASAAPKPVSSAILTNFHIAYKRASDICWSVTNDYTKAMFTEDNAKIEVYYTFNGDVIGTSKNIALDDLPLCAKRSFAKQFAGFTVKEAIRLDGFGEVAYYISGENDKEAVILKVNEDNQVSLFTKTKK